MKRIILPLNHFALPFVALWFFAASPGFAAPQIECSNPRYDFGARITGNAITNRFILENPGDEPLEIVQIKNCCGVETEVVPMTILPGSNAVCTSVFTTRNRYGTQDKQILLVTNDKKNLYYDLRMTGTLLKPVEFEPRYIRLKDVLPDAVVSAMISVTNLLEEEITLESVSATVPGLEASVVRDDQPSPRLRRTSGSRLQEVTGDSADCSVKATVSEISAPQRSWTVQLKSIGPLAIGSINGQVQLHFSTGTVNVPVVGSANPIVQATPDKIQLASATSSKEVERFIMLRSGDGRAFEVISAKLANVDGQVEAKQLANGQWRVKLALIPDSVKTDASVVIKTTNESQGDLVIPVQVR